MMKRGKHPRAQGCRCVPTTYTITTNIHIKIIIVETAVDSILFRNGRLFPSILLIFFLIRTIRSHPINNFTSRVSTRHEQVAKYRIVVSTRSSLVSNLERCPPPGPVSAQPTICDYNVERPRGVVVVGCVVVEVVVRRVVPTGNSGNDELASPFKDRNAH